MFIPDGYTESEVLKTISKVLDLLAPTFTFGYYDEDDIRQEGFIFAHEAIERFSPKNHNDCSLYTFLLVHIRNRLLNLQRNKMARPTPPCLFCPSSKDGICSKYDHIEDCVKWRNWETRNRTKKNLLESSDMHSMENSIGGDRLGDICASLSKQEILTYICENIPLSMRADYKRLIEGAPLTKKKRLHIIEVVKELLKGLFDGKTETEH